jgi:hypothetical protein
MAGKIGKLEKLLASAVLGFSLLAHPLTRAYSQDDACDISNPNYCFECRDESKRDFDKCGEIDYTKYSLAEFDAAGRVLKWPMSSMDYDPYRKKAVISLDIGKVEKKGDFKVEIFVVEGDHEVKDEQIQFTLDPKKFKRITYSDTQVANLYPFWTKDRKIVYKTARYSKKNGLVVETYAHMIDEDGRYIKKVVRGGINKEYSKLLREAHPIDFLKRRLDILTVDVPPADYKPESEK